jgi:periplasmic protein TonB
MNYLEELEQGRYGSFEIKKMVGPNLLKGLAISVLIHLVLISSPYIIQLLKGEEEIPPPPSRVVDITQLTKLRSQQDNTTEQVKIVQAAPAAPKVTRLVAVVDDEVVDNNIIMPSQQEISAATAGSTDALDIGVGEKIEIREEVTEEIAPVGTFTAREIDPVAYKDNPKPEFPELAKMAGVTGKVVAWVYVNKKGEVKDYKIISAKPPNLGFEEEVAKVVMKWKFSPAIQSGNPVGLWISYPFIFSIQK